MTGILQAIGPTIKNLLTTSCDIVRLLQSMVSKNYKGQKFVTVADLDQRKRGEHEK